MVNAIQLQAKLSHYKAALNLAVCLYARNKGYCLNRHTFYTQPVHWAWVVMCPASQLKAASNLSSVHSVLFKWAQDEHIIPISRPGASTCSHICRRKSVLSLSPSLSLSHTHTHTHTLLFENVLQCELLNLLLTTKVFSTYHQCIHWSLAAPIHHCSCSTL